MTIFELWVKGCKDLNTDIIRLENENDCQLFETKSQFEHKHFFYNNPVVYHVWERGRSVCSTTDYLSAYKKWKNVATEKKE